MMIRKFRTNLRKAAISVRRTTAIWLILLTMMPMLSAPVYSRTMKTEADEFLSNMAPGLQKRQEEAIRLAITGDCSLLNEVRASRNTPAKAPCGVSVTDIDSRYRLYRPDSASTPLPLLIYFHGGGWCFGSLNSCAEFCGQLACRSGIAVLAVEYPLAPEFPYPAALDACVEAVRFAADNAEKYGFNPERISVGGDSAGGNLALATALRLTDNGSHRQSPKLNGLVLFYPVVKVWNDGSASWNAYGYGYGLDSGIMEAFNEAYVNGADPVSELISPYCAPENHLKRLPPALIINAERDILCDQGHDMYLKLDTAGVKAERHVFPGATHLFITVAGQPSAFREALRLTSIFLLSL